MSKQHACHKLVRKSLDFPFLCYNTSQRRKFEENSTEGNLCWREVVFFIWQQLCLPSTSQREPQCFLNDEQRVKMSEASGSLGGPSRGSPPRRNTWRRRGRDVSHLSQKVQERRGWKERDEKQMRNMIRKKIIHLFPSCMLELPQGFNKQMWKKEQCLCGVPYVLWCRNIPEVIYILTKRWRSDFTKQEKNHWKVENAEC